MNALRNYYEIVFNLDQFLEVLLGEQLIENSNLKDVFNDVIFVGDRNCISQFYEYQMKANESNLIYIEDLIELILSNKSNDTQLEINFFSQKRFKYLLNLIGSDYFTKLLLNFNIYKLDENECVYLQLGKKLNDQNKKIIDEYDIVTYKLTSPSNIEFCKDNFQKLGKFNPDLPIRREKDIDNLYDANLAIFYELLGENHNELNELFESKMNLDKKSHLLDPARSGKYHFYLYDDNDHCLNRDSIYENQNLELNRDQFIKKYTNMTKYSLFDQIYKKDEEIYKLIYNKNIDKKLLELFDYFLNGHKNCNFYQKLIDECRDPKIDIDFINYDPQKDLYPYLYSFNKQEEVAKYCRKILELLIDVSIINEENLKAIYQLFNLIPFQNGEIKLYFSNFYNNMKFTEISMLKDVQIMDKIRIIDLFIKWLADYVIELLSCSFYVVKEKRLRFYRFDYWNKIRECQMNYWLKIDKIKIVKDVDLDNNYLNTKFKLNIISDFLQIDSCSDDNLELEIQFRLIGQLLNCVCNSIYGIFQNEIDLYNEIKVFHKRNQIKDSDNIYYFKYEFEEILTNLVQDKLLEILDENLDQFANDYKLNNFKLKNLQTFKKISKLQKQDIYYIDLDDENLLHNLKLNGYELEDSIIYLHEQFDYELNLGEIKELIKKFIKKNILHLDSTTIQMKSGIPSNKFITKQMIMIYLYDLIDKTKPKDESNIMFCIDENGFLILRTDLNYAHLHFENLDKLIPEYNLKLNEKETFQIFDNQLDYSTRKYIFKKFEFIFRKNKFINYKNDIFTIRNIKSSHSFNLFEITSDFQDNIIETFFHYFRPFILDEDFFDFENVIYELFNYYGLFAIQICHFFLNSHQLIKDENPALLFNIIKNLLVKFFEQLKYYSTKINDFQFTIDFSIVAWLLVKCFIIIWKNRQMEIELLNKLESYFKSRIDIDLEREYNLKNIYDTLKQTALISKSAGGIGVNVHCILATGSYISGTNGYSNGLMPMVKVYNETANYVDQGGNNRPGAFAIYLEPWHADIFEFLDLKKIQVNNPFDETFSREANVVDLFLSTFVNIITDFFREKYSGFLKISREYSTSFSDRGAKEFKQYQRQMRKEMNYELSRSETYSKAEEKQDLVRDLDTLNNHVQIFLVRNETSEIVKAIKEYLRSSAQAAKALGITFFP